jgi:oxygen-dependent protoporphyrinogen oxidase
MSTNNNIDKPKPITDSTKPQLDVIIIGGGISGLSTAWWLVQSGLTVQVWEKSARAGGKIKSRHHQGFITEQAASMIMDFKPEVDQFFNHSGLSLLKENRSLNAEKQRYLIHQGQLKALPMTLSKLFFSSLWSTSGKFRLLMEPFIGKAQINNETVSEFISRRLGQEFLEKAIEPFIAGTLASDPDYANAAQVIPRLTALEKKFGSITAGIFIHKLIGKRTARNPQSFSFVNGMETLVQQLANNESLGFQHSIHVNNIIQHGTHHWEVQAQNSRGEMQATARHVIISSPADIAAQLLTNVDTQLSQLLTQINYTPLSVVHIGLPRSAIQHPLDSAGFLVPRIEQKKAHITINGNLWMSSIFSQRAPDECVLLSSYLGGCRYPEVIHLSTEESVHQVLSDIRPLLGIRGDPIMTHVDRHQQALPLYHGHYSQILQAIQQRLTTLSGLHLQANYIGGVSVRDRIATAKQTAEKIINQLSFTSSNNSITKNHHDYCLNNIMTSNH